jgi:hypothetical protein
MELTVPLETICRLIVRARELEAQVPAIETDDEEDPSDSDDPFAVLEDEANSSVEEEITGLLEDLAEDEVAEVLALALIGRGTYDASEWDDAIEEAGDGTAADAISQIREMPMLAAYLEAGLAAFDLSCDGIGQID